MNLAVVALAVGLIFISGFWQWLIIQVIVTSVSGTCWPWLFYVQHQFEDAYWERGENWDYTDATMPPAMPSPTR